MPLMTVKNQILNKTCGRWNKLCIEPMVELCQVAKYFFKAWISER